MNLYKETCTNKSRDFFCGILANLMSTNIDKIVAVVHMVPGTEEFVESINDKLPIAALIPKQSSMNLYVKKKINKKIPIMDYTRKQIIANHNQFLEELKFYVGDSNFAIIDIGGYFSHILYELYDVFGSNLIGIVEDTENGHQKYQSLLKGPYNQFPCPIISVARSNLKEPEDYLVGQAIVYSAESVLRDLGNIMTGKNALVLGYGKIGSSIARGLKSKVGRVNVIDIDPSRQLLALAQNFQTGSKANLLSNADLIFCATGNCSISLQDIGDINNNAYIFTATSADDEIENHHSLINRGLPHPENNNITIIKNDMKNCFLCNNGKSINFLHGGIVGPFIKPVQGELIFALAQLSYARKDQIIEIDKSSKSFIADLWIDCFHS